MANTYFSIHNHSMFSFRDGYATPKEYLETATKIGLKGFAITEHGNQCSWVYFDKIKQDYPSVKMVYGIEFYEYETTELSEKDNKYYHLLVLAKNDNGRKLLNKLQRLSNDNFYYKPRVHLDMFREEDCSNIIVSSACLASLIAKNSDNIEKCIYYIEEYKKVFPHFYLEMQSHNHKDQENYNKVILKLSELTKTPYIIATDSHYAKKEDALYHSWHVKNSKDKDTISEIYEGCYLQSVEEIHECMDKQIGKEYVEKGLQETLKLLEIIDEVSMPWQEPQLPLFEIPKEFSNDFEYLNYLTKEVGWKNRRLDQLSEDNQKNYRDRLDYELNIINTMGFNGYFLIVWDFIDWAKKNGIEVGAGRGCFTKNALVWCKDSMKTINNVNIGDEVLSADGKFNKVLNTMSYDINESLIRFEYQMQGSSDKEYKNECTLDHNILVFRNGTNEYIKAKELKIGDLLCSPKIKEIGNKKITYDLNKYNIFGYEYDDEYIYEQVFSCEPFDYSSSDMEKRGICTKRFAQKVARREINYNSKNKKHITFIESFFKNTPFKNDKEYQEYVQKNRIVKRKIKRFVTIDEKWNELIGMMYGDGWIINGKKHYIGLTTNSSNFKDIINKNLFYEVMESIGLIPYSEHINKKRNVNQYFVYSKIVVEWLSDFLFVSEKGKDKHFNTELLDQPKEYINAIRKGFINTDGSLSKGTEKKCFDNTSLSLISAFKYTQNLLSTEPVALDMRYAYTNYDDSKRKESYKLRWLNKRTINKIIEDDNYWYLPVTKIEQIDQISTKVYDLTIEHNPSYTINNIVVHNSACSSVCDWLLGISEPDPLKYKLVFERFLNPERVSMPDIDCDFSDREKIVEYLINKYGEDKVAQVCNFNYITPLVAVKTACKITDVPFSVANKLSSHFSYKTWSECVENENDFIENNIKYQEVFEIASRLSGRVNAFATHAGGLVIARTTLDDYIGTLKTTNEGFAVNVDKKMCESIGLVKFDLLGVATLSIVKEVKNDTGMDNFEININNSNFTNDEKTYNLIAEAKTNAIFQLESAGMKDLCLRLKPNNVEEISDILALYRPDARMSLEDYIKNKSNKESIRYWCDEAKDILSDTYGALLYQEEMMDIVRVIGGRTYGGADKFRKGVGKKDLSLVIEEATLLKKEIVQNGFTEELAQTISDYLMKFGNYLFCKSHSIGYSVLTLQTAYLKAHYPLYFFKALLNENKNDYGKLNKYILDAKEFGVDIVAPSINLSQRNFSVIESKVLFGLEAIKGLGEKFVEDILEERKNGVFKNLLDFKSRVSVGTAQIVSLIKSGAIPCKDKRKFLLGYAKGIYSKKEYKPVSSFTGSLEKNKELYGFDFLPLTKEDRLIKLNEFKKIDFDTKQEETFNKKIYEFSEKYLADEDYWQFETLSVFLENNPFVESIEFITGGTVEEIEDGQDGVECGIISNISKRKDKNGNPFAFVSLYTLNGIIELACWSSQYKEFKDLIIKGEKITVLYTKKEDTLTVQKMKLYKEWLQEKRDIKNE